jgi:hypothetical protein
MLIVRAKKAAIFFVACEQNPATRVKIPNAMRIKGYFPSKATNQVLQMQVRCEAEKIKGEAIPDPPAPAAVAASALLALASVATTGRSNGCSHCHGGWGVANTRERQEALAAVHTHGKKFFVTGGKHVTSDDMFIVVELNWRRVEAAEREKDKKSRVEYHARRKAALLIIDRLENELENDVGQLKSKELKVLLRWKGVPVLTMGNVVNRRIFYQQFAEGGAEEAGIPASWTEINEAEFIALRDAPIAMCDTAYGWFEEQKKRDVERANQKMTATEKEVFKRKMAEINKADAGDEETLPPTPPPPV